MIDELHETQMYRHKRHIMHNTAIHFLVRMKQMSKLPRTYCGLFFYLEGHILFTYKL